MVMYREVCPEGVQNKCPGGVWCRGFMSWGDTLILVISRGVQLYYGIAHCESIVSQGVVYTVFSSCMWSSHVTGFSVDPPLTAHRLQVYV